MLKLSVWLVPSGVVGLPASLLASELPSGGAFNFCFMSKMASESDYETLLYSTMCSVTSNLGVGAHKSNP